MWRYLRLYAYFVRFAFSRAMEFRADFFFRIVMDTVFYAVHIGFFKLIFLHTPSLAGWKEAEVIVFVSGFFVVDALIMTLFSNNLWWLPQLINRGDLDYYLVRPVSSLFFVSFRDFAANSFMNLLIACGILGWAIWNYAAPLSTASVALYLVMLLVGAMLYFSIQMLLLLPVFWTHSGEGFRAIGWQLGNFMGQPDRIFTGWTRRVLVTVVPAAVVASFPARLLLEGFQWSVLLHMLGVSLAFWILLIWLWNRALKNYSSASS